MASFRQLEQRHVSSEISLLEWNPALDLIALGTATGEILLHRLSWQRVWALPAPPQDTAPAPPQVTALAWRPDGKILAYAHDNGKVTLCDVENAEMVHVLDVHCVVTSLTWVQCTDPHTAEPGRTFYVDHSDDFLTKHYASNKAYAATSKQSEEVADDFKKMKGQKDLNILAIGMETGLVHLHSFGMFPTGFIDVNIRPELPEKSRVMSVTLSADFRVLSVVLERKDEDGNYCYFYRSYHMSLLANRMEEIKVVSLKYGQISSLLTYLSSTIRAISEAWEDILMEVDTKLHNYALQKQEEEASISDDFLELLMFGNPSDSLEKFLMHDLTEGGLKKFGHSIELSYSNIQKLVLKRLQNVSSSLFYHLNEFKGMALWKRRFGDLGLDEQAIHSAVMMVGSFLLKATEIQQVIDNSMKNFKAFFRWLYSVILRLSEEPIPVEVSKLTQQDLQFVAEFLKDNFVVKYDAEGRKTTVKLERVAQYLKKEDLPYPPPTAGNPWIKFLEEHPNMQDTGFIFPNYPEKSLVTLYSDVRKVIDVAVKGTWHVLHKTATLRSFHPLHQNKQPSVPIISNIGCPDYTYTIVTDQSPPCSRFYVLREHTRDDGPLEAVAVYFHRDNSKSAEKEKSFHDNPKEEKSFEMMDFQVDNPKQTVKDKSFHSDIPKRTEKAKISHGENLKQTEKDKSDNLKQIEKEKIFQSDRPKQDQIFPIDNPSKQPEKDKPSHSDSPKQPEKDKSYQVLDVKFYSREVISVLLAEDDAGHCPVLFQLPVRHLLGEMRPLEQGHGAVHGPSLMERGSFKSMEGVRASHMAVSGSRKVVCVLFASKRQVRLFEMDVEEDEEEEDSVVMQESHVETDEEAVHE